jgi:hypothetical protein
MQECSDSCLFILVKGGGSPVTLLQRSLLHHDSSIEVVCRTCSFRTEIIVMRRLRIWESWKFLKSNRSSSKQRFMFHPDKYYWTVITLVPRNWFMCMQWKLHFFQYAGLLIVKSFKELAVTAVLVQLWSCCHWLQQLLLLAAFLLLTVILQPASHDILFCYKEHQTARDVRRVTTIFISGRCNRQNECRLGWLSGDIT